MSDLNYILQRLEAIDTKFDEKLDKILVQTTKTNGRVTALEDKVSNVFTEVEDLKQHKNYNKGRDKVIYIILGGIGALALALASIYLK
jgi:tetrahydromethanopterin S-methyltransferase subunit G